MFLLVNNLVHKQKHLETFCLFFFFKFVNPALGDTHNHGCLLCTITNMATFSRIAKQINFVKGGTTVFSCFISHSSGHTMPLNLKIAVVSFSHGLILFDRNVYIELEVRCCLMKGIQWKWLEVSASKMQKFRHVGRNTDILPKCQMKISEPLCMHRVCLVVAYFRGSAEEPSSN